LKSVIVAACVFMVCAAASIAGLRAKHHLPLDEWIRIVPDDAFYYFRIAENHAGGKGWTFDGRNPTTGFHPVYALLLSSGISLFGVAHEGIPSLGAVICGVCLAASSLAAFCLARRHFSAFASFLVAGLWIILPYNFETTISCMESASVLLGGMALLLLWSWNLELEAGGKDTRWPYITLGAACAASILLRSDMALMLGGMGLASLPLRKTSCGTQWRAPRTFICIVCGALAGVLALSLFCRSVTGKWSQDSGRMKALWAQRNDLRTREGIERRARNWQWVTCHMAASPIGVPDWDYDKNQSARSLATVVLTIAGVWLIIQFLRNAGVTTIFGRMAAAAVVHLLTLSMIFGWALAHPQPRWYFASAQLSYLMLGLAALRWASDRMSKKRYQPTRAALALAVLLIAFLMDARNSGRKDLFPHQIDFMRAARHIAKVLPPDARIGAWNAGILSYYSGREVVNLDGVVNSAIEPFARRGAVSQYVLDEKIGWLADHESQFMDRYQTPLFVKTPEELSSWTSKHLLVMASIPVDNPADYYYSSYLIWQVKP